MGTEVREVGGGVGGVAGGESAEDAGAEALYFVVVLDESGEHLDFLVEAGLPEGVAEFEVVVEGGQELGPEQRTKSFL